MSLGGSCLASSRCEPSLITGFSERWSRASGIADAPTRGMTNAEEILSRDGTKLYVRTWLPEGTPRAVVVLVHGLKAHSGLYEWPASEMAKAGFAVYALDLRGHGKSGGAPLFAETMDDYVDDVRAVVKLAK